MSEILNLNSHVGGGLKAKRVGSWLSVSLGT
jgi:hypothetical protein